MDKANVGPISLCPIITDELYNHLESVFFSVVKFIPGTPDLEQWAAYKAGIDVVLEYMKGAKYVQRYGTEHATLGQLKQSTIGPPVQQTDPNDLSIETIIDRLRKKGLFKDTQ